MRRPIPILPAAALLLAAAAAALLLLCVALRLADPPSSDPAIVDGGGLASDGDAFSLRRRRRRRRLSSFLKARDPKSVRAKSFPDLPAQFLEAVKARNTVPDMVTTHDYQLMYGQFLLPHYLLNPDMKMLEIGWGCDMPYGPGASAGVWRDLFPTAELWIAKKDGGCVEDGRAAGMLDGMNVLVGDQGDVATLDRWIAESGGGDFDVVVDDGGHRQCQIWTSFVRLWPHLNPGGLYFVTALQVSRSPAFNRASSAVCEPGTNVVDNFKEMAGELASGGRSGKVELEDVKFVFCQREGCVIGKEG